MKGPGIPGVGRPVPDVPESLSSQFTDFNDFNSFYESTFKDGLLKSFAIVDKGDFKESLQQSKDDLPLWFFEQYPSYEAKKIGYDRMNNLQVGYSNIFEQSTKQMLAGESQRRAFLSAPDLAFPESSIPASELPAEPRFSALDNSLHGNSKLKWLVCLKFALLRALKCSRALDDILKLMLPSGSLTAIPVLKEVIENPSYIEGTSRAALKVMDKVNKYGEHSVEPLGSLFDDILSSFVETGVEKRLAEEMTWNLMAVFGTRGTNIGLLFKYAAIAATSISELGYQMFSRTAGREVLFTQILTNDFFSSAANKTRIDLAFAFAGANFGANQTAGKASRLMVDIDYTVKKMFSKAKTLKPWSIEMVDKYLKHPVKKFILYARWLFVISPEHTYRDVAEQTGCSSFLRRAINTPFGLNPQ